MGWFRRHSSQCVTMLSMLSDDTIQEKEKKRSEEKTSTAVRRGILTPRIGKNEKVFFIRQKSEKR